MTRVEKFIPFDEAIHTLRITPLQFSIWQREGRFETRPNENGKDCIGITDLEKLAYSPDVHDLAIDTFKTDIARREKEEVLGRSALQLRNAKLVEKYRRYIGTLEDVHRSYHNRLGACLSNT
jgi:hypothetical protein